MKKIIILIPIIIVLVAGILLLQKRKQEIKNLPTANQVNSSVRVILPEERKVTEKKPFLALLEADRRVEAASKLSGRINELLVKEGQRVKKGELLLQLDDKEIIASINGVKAQLTAAKSRLDYNRKLYVRNSKLYKAGGLPEEKLEESKVGLESAQAAVQELEAKIESLNNQLNYTRITAPLDAVVGSVLQHQGDLVVPGRPILTLNSMEQKLTFSFVPEVDKIQTGQKVHLRDKANMDGKVSTIYNDARKGLAVAEVQLNKTVDLPMGSYLPIMVTVAEQTGCTLPLQSLLHRKDSISVMVLTQEGNFAEKKVEVVVKDEDYALIQPCIQSPVAIGSEAKLSLLPSLKGVKTIGGGEHE